MKAASCVCALFSPCSGKSFTSLILLLSYCVAQFGHGPSDLPAALQPCTRITGSNQNGTGQTYAGDCQAPLSSLNCGSRFLCRIRRPGTLRSMLQLRARPCILQQSACLCRGDMAATSMCSFLDQVVFSTCVSSGYSRQTSRENCESFSLPSCRLCSVSCAEHRLR